jgi:putative ubiquitin-RnfH superfamily antitoxin RatB of RatAB toxin-antitoxin module
MEKPEAIRIEVVYPLPHEQLLLAAQISNGATLREGILASGVLERYPELSLDTLRAGIFGKLAKLDETLRDRDRIEIYRPLIADPKAVRKQREADGKRMKKGGGAEADAGEVG